MRWFESLQIEIFVFMLFSSFTPSPTGLCPTRFGCQGPTRAQCHGLLKRYEEQIDDSDNEIEEDQEAVDPQLTRHIILLILLLCSMFVVSSFFINKRIIKFSYVKSSQGLAISIWTLIMEEMSGIYIEIAFLDAILNFGQSLIVFVIFGMDTKELLVPLLKCWRKIYYGANVLPLPNQTDLSAESKHICDQFTTHHLENCIKAIAKDTRCVIIRCYQLVTRNNDFF